MFIQKRFFTSILVLIATVLIAGSVSANHTACSIDAPYLININFVNNSGGPIDIFWIDYACAEVIYADDLADGATFSQATFPSHPWIIYDATTGDPLYCFIAQRNASITIRGGSYKNHCLLPHDELGANLNPPDERINWQYGDLGVVLYQGTDEAGNPAIDAYCYDGTNTWLGMQVTTANMENGMTGTGCDVTFYHLPDSAYPYQWNIVFDGKLYEILCTDLTCEDRIRRYFDPNE